MKERNPVYALHHSITKAFGDNKFTLSLHIEEWNFYVSDDEYEKCCGSLFMYNDHYYLSTSISLLREKAKEIHQGWIDAASNCELTVKYARSGKKKGN